MDKDTMRREGIAARKAIAEPERSQYNKQICEKLIEITKKRGAKTVLSYCSANGEVDLSLFDQTAKNLGITVLYPFCISDTVMIACKLGGKGLVKGKYGIYAPDYPINATQVDIAKIDLVLMPATRFDLNKNRLGMGKGYYDRYLIQNPNLYKILVAYEVQSAKEIVCSSHDIAADIVVTELN